MDGRPVLQSAPSHFNWKLDNGTNKTFESLETQLHDHIEENPETMTVPALLFMSFLHMSGFKGPKIDYKTAKIYLNKALDAINCLDHDSPSWIGYLTIAKANEAIIESMGHSRRGRSATRKVQTLVDSLEELISKKTKQSDAYVHIAQAFALSRLGLSKYEDAQKYYKLAVEVEPENTQWLFGLALTIGRRARTVYRHDRKKYRDLPPAIKEEKRLYEQIIRIDKSHAHAWAFLGQVYQIEGNQERALECCLKATRLADSNAGILRLIGKLFRKDGLYKQALTIFQSCEDSGAKSSYMYHHWGLVYRDMSKRQGGSYRGRGRRGQYRNLRGQGRTSEGRGHMSESSGRPSENRGRFFQNRGRSFENRGRGRGSYSSNPEHERDDRRRQTRSDSEVDEHLAEEAIDKFEKALTCNPGNSFALLDKARMYEAIGNLEAARDDFEELVRIPNLQCHDQVVAHFNFGLFLENTFQDEDDKYAALDHFRIAIDVAIQNSTFAWTPGKDGFNHPQFVEKIRENVESAIYKFKRIASAFILSKDAEKKCDGLRQSAWLDYELGYVDDAVSMYEACLNCEGNGDDTEALEGVSKCYTKLRKFSEVNKVLERLGALKPDIAKECKAESRKYEGQLALRNGEFQRARQIFLEALDLGSIHCFEETLQVLQNGPIKERHHWEFRADCAKLLHHYQIADPDKLKNITEQLSTVGIDNEETCATKSPVCFTDRVKDLMELQHNVCGKMRQSHLQMEQVILKGGQNQKETRTTLEVAADVFSKATPVLGYVMMAFKKKYYPDSKPKACPYFYISAGKESKIGNDNAVRVDVLKRLEKDYKWLDVGTRFAGLLDFLIKIQPAYDLENNWYRAMAKLNNLSKHDDALNYAAYAVPKFVIEKNDDSAVPLGDPVFTGVSTSGSTSTAGGGSGNELSTATEVTDIARPVGASNDAVVDVDKKYQKYEVRALARKASTEVEIIAAQFSKYIDGCLEN